MHCGGLQNGRPASRWGANKEVGEGRGHEMKASAKRIQLGAVKRVKRNTCAGSRRHTGGWVVSHGGRGSAHTHNAQQGAAAQHSKALLHTSCHTVQHGTAQQHVLGCIACARGRYGCSASAATAGAAAAATAASAAATAAAAAARSSPPLLAAAPDAAALLPTATPPLAASRLLLPAGRSNESAGSNGLMPRATQLVWHMSGVHPLMISRLLSLRRYSACGGGEAGAGRGIVPSVASNTARAAGS